MERGPSSLLFGYLPRSHARLGARLRRGSLSAFRFLFLLVHLDVAMFLVVSELLRQATSSSGKGMFEGQ